jgi:hypothetical protein
MRFSYRVVDDGASVVAECVEADCAGTGRTEADAVESLRELLAERMLRAEAVAPPSKPPRAQIELVRTS